MYNRILVPIDESPLSGKALGTAIPLALRLGGGLVVLHVVPPYPAAHFEEGITISREDAERIELGWAKQAEAAVARAVQTARAQGVAAFPLVVKSDHVAETILATAKKEHCDAIVMASHGRRGVSRLLLGSETQHVLTHGRLPVLVVR